MEPQPIPLDICQLSPSTPNTNILITPENLPQLDPLLTRVLRFVNETSSQVGDTFAEEFSNYQTDVRKKPADPILSYLQNSRLNLPRFTILDRQPAKSFFEHANHPEEDIDNKNLLLVFRMPKPVAAFWTKTKNRNELPSFPQLTIRRALKEMLADQEVMLGTTDEMRDKIRRLAKKQYTADGPLPIEWGRFGWALSNITMRNVEQRIESKELDFRRINGVKEHDENLYYYMWETSLPADKGTNET